jgi:hypothetical protein
MRLVVVDQADLRGGAAHVEGQRAAFAGARRDLGREDGTAGGAGFDQPHRKLARRLDRGQAAARGDEIDRAAEALRLQRRLHAAEIAVHQRLHIGIRHRGAGAFVLAHFRAHLARQRHPQVGQRRLQDLARAPLVRRVDVGMQIRDRDALDALGAQERHERAHRRLVQRQSHLAVHVDALRHGQAQGARHQRLRLLDGQVVLVVAALVGDIEHVAEPLGRDQRRARAAPLDHRVGGERGAVHEHVDVGEAQPRVAEDDAHASEHALLRPDRRGEHLAREALSACLENHVGERAADIDGEAGGGMGAQDKPMRPERCEADGKPASPDMQISGRAALHCGANGLDRRAIAADGTNRTRRG